MIKKTIFAAVIAAAALCLTIPAAAEPQTYTTGDGVLSIDLPDENWKEMSDPGKWVSFSDGANLITLEHLSNGEDLPDISIADDHYVNVYQAIASTQNEVFIITGSVVDSAKIGDVCNAIMSVKVLKYDTKLAVKKEQQETSAGYTIVAMDATMYATAGVNVRAGYSTSDQILGGIGTGTSVHVTGKVQKDGADIGWYQVSYNNGTGYISSSFLSDKAPSGSTDSGSVQFTGDARTIYANDGSAVTIYKRTDGKWSDSQGNTYTQVLDYEFQGDNLLIARINVLLSFVEYMQDRLKRFPTKKEVNKILNIIAWNIWQMDGITGLIPFGKPQEIMEDLFKDNYNDTVDKFVSDECRIYDWRSKCSLTYNSMKRGN